MSTTRLPQWPLPPPRPHCLLTRSPQPGGSPGLSNGGGSVAPRVAWRQKGADYLLCSGEGGGGGGEGERFSGTQPSRNYSSSVVRSDDATPQEWQRWLASAPGARGKCQAGMGLIRPRAPRWVLPALVGGVPNLPGYDLPTQPAWCCSGCFPSWLQMGKFCLAVSGYVGGTLRGCSHDLVSWSPACSGPASKI